MAHRPLLPGFAPAALLQFRHHPRRPIPAARGSFAPGPPGEGSANHVLLSARHVLKVRADPLLDAARETWALKRLPPETAPLLLGHATLHELREVAARRGDHASLAALDVPLGPVMLLERVPGAMLRAPTESQALAAGELVARLHRVTRDGPRLPSGSHPGAVMGAVDDAWRDLQLAGVMGGTTRGHVARAVMAVGRHVDRAWNAWPEGRVRTLCHGDLRWHNMVVAPGDRLRVVDLEHAGIGDPAVDLALMSCRTPLSRHEELCVLDGYLARRADRTLLRRMEILLPPLALLGGLEAVLDLVRVVRGTRTVASDARAHVASRLPFVVDELQASLERALVRRVPVPSVRLRRPARRATGKPRPLCVAVDGTALSGKSLLAGIVAEERGLEHLNTGLMYRWVAFTAWQHGWTPRGRDLDHALSALARARLELLGDGTLVADGEVFAERLGVLPVDVRVAAWARVPQVRDAVGARMRRALQRPRVLVEGRDVASVLRPDAHVAVFVDAGLQERALRLVRRTGALLTVAHAARLIEARDHADRTRTVAPMLRVRGAVLVDTSQLSAEEAAARVLRVLEKART